MKNLPLLKVFISDEKKLAVTDYTIKVNSLSDFPQKPQIKIIKIEQSKKSLICNL